MFCSNCGTKLTDDSVFCHECGERLPSNEKEQEARPPARDTSPPSAGPAQEGAVHSEDDGAARIAASQQAAGPRAEDDAPSQATSDPRSSTARAQQQAASSTRSSAASPKALPGAQRIGRGTGKRPSPWRVVLIGLAAAVVVIGLGGRAIAPAMADTDCWELGGEEAFGLRAYCAGDTDLGGQCAGLQERSADRLNPAAEICAFPAAVLQEVSLPVVAVISLAIAAALMLPVILTAQPGGRPGV